MVEIKSGNTPVGHDGVASEQSVQNVQDRLTQMAGRDRRHRGDADGIDQLLSAVQEILPPMPLLGLRAEAAAAPAAEKMGTAGKMRSQETGVPRRDKGDAAGEAGIENKGTGHSQVPVPSSSGLKEGGALPGVTTAPAEIPGATHSSASAQSLRQPPGGMNTAGGGADATVAATLSSIETSGRVDTSRKEVGASIGDEVQPQAKPSSAENGQENRAPGAASTQTPASRTHTAAAAAKAAHAAALSAANSPVGTTRDGWVYSFRSWEGQHAVRVSQATGTHNTSPSSFASLALHPNSALVEQRLSAHGDMTGQSDQWVLQEYGKEERQRQQDQDARQGRRQRQEEDES